MIEFTVLLKDGTTGTVCSDTLGGQHAEAFLGDIINIHARDENGIPFEAEGELVEVLEINTLF